jgi:hypothetical protein
MGLELSAKECIQRRRKTRKDEGRAILANFLNYWYETRQPTSGARQLFFVETSHDWTKETGLKI